MKPPSVATGTTAVVLAAIVVLVSGCAEITLGKPTLTTTPVRTTSRVRPTATPSALVTQDDTRLQVRATYACERVPIEIERVTEERERENAAPALDWMFGAAGVAAVGAGVGLVIDASATYPNDPTSQEYNPHGPALSRAAGIAAIGAGALMLVVPIVDMIRAGGRETATRLNEVPGKATAAPCTATRPVVNAPVALRVGSEEVALGTTDKEGSLDVDLSEQIPRSAPAETTADLFIGEAHVGSVELEPVHYANAEFDWTLISRRCREPADFTDCDSVEGYLKKQPGGRYADEAAALLKAAEPRLSALRDAAVRDYVTRGRRAARSGQWQEALSAARACLDILDAQPCAVLAAQAETALARQEEQRAREAVAEEQRRAIQQRGDLANLTEEALSRVAANVEVIAGGKDKTTISIFLPDAIVGKVWDFLVQIGLIDAMKQAGLRRLYLYPCTLLEHYDLCRGQRIHFWNL